MDVIDWLLASDPAIRWQVMRDLAGVAPDERVGDAVRLVADKRQADGTWLLEGSHADTLDVAFGESLGEPSRWNTLRALRVLRWYEDARRSPAIGS